MHARARHSSCTLWRFNNISVSASEDTERHWKDTATCIRLMRDGLRNSADHLNLCRKHVYTSVLMLLNWCNDGATMQSAIDLLQRGLQHQDSARYLLDRCALIRWLEGQCLPPKATTHAVDHLAPIGNRLAPRMLVLMRMALHASALLSWQLETVVTDISKCAMRLVDAVVTGEFATSADYWYQLTCLLVDIRMIGEGKAGTQIGKSACYEPFTKLDIHNCCGEQELAHELAA